MGLRALFQSLETYRQQGQPLIEIIMEFSSDAAAFFLLGADQPAGHFLQRALGVFAFRDVHHDADHFFQRSVFDDGMDRVVEPDCSPVGGHHTIFQRMMPFVARRATVRRDGF